ncbi:conjugal transfer nickase/helicase TraI [Escherichia coli]|uniref:Conjugal transfer nickase/helicase TraI n=1 Tax=Escherichia coli TaxID=562 RepID=A0A376TW26_ECOLX|nr:conjugal transfer nickase/helicase TraI [Escherichia coli]
MTRHTIDRVAEATNSLVLQGEDGSRLTLKVSQLDGSWSLYRSRTLTVSEGDRVRALGREAEGGHQSEGAVHGDCSGKRCDTIAQWRPGAASAH